MAEKFKTLGGMNQRPTGGQPVNPRPSFTPVKKTVSSTPLQRQQIPAQPTMASQPAPAAPVRQVSAPKPSFSAPVQPTAAPQASGEGGILSMLKEMTGAFAYIDDSVVAKNIDLAAGQGMTADDRMVPFEVADYFVGNVAYIIMAAIFDKNFKQQFLDAVALEIMIDQKTPDEKREIRRGMKSPTPPTYSGYIVLGISSFSPQLESVISTKMERGFANLDKYADEFDAKVNSLSDEEKREYGFIVSNWMYLIRAITHNDLFSAYIVSVVEQLKDKLK